MLRAAVIGMGPIGNNHATAYKNCKQAELIAVCDIRKDRADSSKAKYNVPAYYNAEDMLKRRNRILSVFQPEDSNTVQITTFLQCKRLMQDAMY